MGTLKSAPIKTVRLSLFYPEKANLWKYLTHDFASFTVAGTALGSHQFPSFVIVLNYDLVISGIVNPN